MRRLIDADTVISIAKGEFGKDNLSKILWLISHVPTAYYQDKVVKQLEELEETYRKERDNTCCRSTETDDCDRCRADHYLEARIRTINKVIDIVKGGGVNE